jgi:hypothetical protein
MNKDLINSISLIGPVSIIIAKFENKFTLYDELWGIWYVNELGGTSTGPTPKLLFDNIELAFEFAEKILAYFAAELPREHVEDWLKSMEGEEDFSQYKDLSTLVINKFWSAAYNMMWREMDTYVREGVSSRIYHEIIKNLDEIINNLERENDL